MKSTIENLAKAFIGESQARNRYTFYAKIARKEGFEQIAEIFLITAQKLLPVYGIETKHPLFRPWIKLKK